METKKPVRYLSLAGVATYTGYSRNTIKYNWFHRDKRPFMTPDVELGGPAGQDDDEGADVVRQGFLPSTVDNWMENRLGRGARTDLAARRGAGEDPLADSEPAAEKEPPRYLSLKGVATHAGLAYSTVKGYRFNRDKRPFPAPDIELGGPEGHDDDEGADAIQPGWLPSTIDEWMEARPGRGARTDLPPRQGVR